MATPRSIAIFADTPANEVYLAEIVRAAGFTVAVDMNDEFSPILTNLGEIERFHSQKRQILWLSKEKNGLPPAVRLLTPPCRAALVISALQKMMSGQESGALERKIGNWLLDVRDNLLRNSAGDIIRLTEKETALLVFLEDAGGAAVPRQTLLEKVWSYVDGVETHTLETHIYRLRQKIEEDPSAPKIVITQEDGYSLGA